MRAASEHEIVSLSLCDVGEFDLLDLHFGPGLHALCGPAVGEAASVLRAALTWCGIQIGGWGPIRVCETSFARCVIRTTHHDSHVSETIIEKRRRDPAERISGPPLHGHPLSPHLAMWPETGVHPCAIRKRMQDLRGLYPQALLVTASPLILNELAADKITIVSRERATLLCDTPNYAERSRVYANGELWLAYADGVTDSLDDAPAIPKENAHEPV